MLRWTKPYVILALSVAIVGLLGLVAQTTAAETSFFGVLDRQPSGSAKTQLAVPTMTRDERVFVTSLAMESTVRLSARTCSGNLIGSGFVLDGVVVTNRHLVDGASAAKIELGSDLIVARVMATSDDVDMALVDAQSLVESEDGRTLLRWASTNPPVGEALAFAGHAGGGATQVVVSTVHTYASGGPYGVGGDVLLIDAPTQGGFSGGPVFNRQGEVVAMLQGFDRATNLTLAIPVESMSSWAIEVWSAERSDLSGQSGLADLSDIELNSELQKPDCQ